MQIKVGLGRRTEEYSLGKNKEGGKKAQKNRKTQNQEINQFSADCFMPPTPLVFLFL